MRVAKKVREAIESYHHYDGDTDVQIVLDDRLKDCAKYLQFYLVRYAHDGKKLSAIDWYHPAADVASIEWWDDRENEELLVSDMFDEIEEYLNDEYEDGVEDESDNEYVIRSNVGTEWENY